MQAQLFSERALPDAASSASQGSPLFQPLSRFALASPIGDSRSHGTHLELDANPVSAILDSGEEPQCLWLREIRECLLRGKTQTMDLCRVVFSARQSLQHGEWTALWRLEEAPFSKSKADKLARIGSWFKELNAHTCEHLPAGWRILRVLSRLNPRTTCTLVALGKVHAHITLQAAQQLVSTLLIKQPKNSRRAKISTRVNNFCGFVRATLPDWTAEEREQATKEISELLDLITARPLKDPQTPWKQFDATSGLAPQSELGSATPTAL